MLIIKVRLILAASAPVGLLEEREETATTVGSDPRHLVLFLLLLSGGNLVGAQNWRELGIHNGRRAVGRRGDWMGVWRRWRPDGGPLGRGGGPLLGRTDGRGRSGSRATVGANDVDGGGGGRDWRAAVDHNERVEVCVTKELVARGNRTPDFGLRRPTLYPLSYRDVVPKEGIEPPTLGSSKPMLYPFN